MPRSIADPYLPHPARVDWILAENSQIRTFRLAFTDVERQASFRYQPGQFLMVSLPHCGEAPISISSSPIDQDGFELSVRRAGKLTEAMHGLQAGAIIGLRGPYGRPFPLETLRGRDLLFVAGGIGLAPLRSVLKTCLAQRADYGRISLLYGSRSPADIAFAADLAAWQQEADCDCRLTVDLGQADWQGPVGLVTELLNEVPISPSQTSALVCGPSLMIRSVLARLAAMGLAEDRIITTLERQMKCGIGLCGHCRMDGKLVCIEGPVFNLAELQRLAVSELAD